MSSSDYLQSLFWGIPSSGAYSAETTATLGTDRVDRREPPTAYHWSALQTSRMRQLLVLMSTHFKGGSRLRTYPVTANPFSSGEMGVWVDSSASNALKYFNGTTNTTLGAGGGGGTLATTYSAGASQTDSTIGLDSTRLGIRIRDNATPIAGDLTAWQNSGGTVTMLGVRRTGISVSSTVETSGTVLPIVRITPAAHTGMTASTEYSILDESGSVTHQFATGAISSQRFHKLFQHTIAFVGASVVTDAANLWLQGAPSAGANASLTNSWALWVGSGDSLFERNIVGATVGTSALTIGQRDAATSGNQKYSPMMRFLGAGYDADNTVSRTWEIGAQAVPVQGNTVTGSLNFYARLDGGSWSSTPLFQISDGAAHTSGKPIMPGFTSDVVAPSWIAVSGGVGFQNSFVNLGGAYAGTAYWKDALGMAWVYLAVIGGTNGTVIFTLPANYRPARQHVWAGFVATGAGYGTVATNGQVLAFGGSSAGVVATFCFPAEQ